jgi:hypothetical protein
VDEMEREYNEWVNTLSYEDFLPLDEASLWLGWQASRAALKAELPATCCRAFIFDDGSMEHDEYFEVDDIKQMLTDAGVGYE